MSTQVRRTAAIVALGLVAALALVARVAPVDQAAASPAASRAASAASSAKAKAFRPVTGPTFNNPLGSVTEQRKILDYIIKVVDATPRGAVIRVSEWAFGDRAFEASLKRAHNRGVQLRMVIDGHRISDPSKRMQKMLGTNPNKKSYIVHCKNSCRGTTGQNHTKFFMFSETGGVKAVTLVTSANATGYNVNQLWNDLYTVAGSKAVYDSFFRVYEKMKLDRPVKNPYIRATQPNYETHFYPLTKVTNATDPTLKTLKNVKCKGATRGTGEAGRTKIRISMSAWHSTRGAAAANRLAELQKQGCRTRVIFGASSGQGVRDILTRAKIPWKRTTHKGVYTHQKLMLISGVYGKLTSDQRVFTGSHNWTDPSLARDEVVLGTTRNNPAFEKYDAHWYYMWQRS